MCFVCVWEGGGKSKKKWVLRPFQEYFTYIEPTVNQRWAKSGVPGVKPPDLLVQNLASHIHVCRERGSNHSGERSNVYETALLTTGPRRPVEGSGGHQLFVTYLGEGTAAGVRNIWLDCGGRGHKTFGDSIKLYRTPPLPRTPDNKWLVPYLKLRDREP